MVTIRIEQKHLSKLSLTIVSAGVCLMLAGCFGASYTQDSGPTPQVAAPSETSTTTTTTSDPAAPTVESHRTTTSAFLIP
jgi:uncharacterized lipoprotein YajG